MAQSSSEVLRSYGEWPAEASQEIPEGCLFEPPLDLDKGRFEAGNVQLTSDFEGGWLLWRHLWAAQ